MKKKIIFMGTPEFAKVVLKGLIDSNEYEIIAVVTQPDRPVGRKRVLTASPVKELALEHDLPIYQPEKIGSSKEAKELIALDSDLIVTAAYGQFVPNSLLEAPKHTAINVHASLLPKYRGGAPIHYAIWKGEEETGISLIYMTKEMDAGDILAQAKTPIKSTDDVGDLFDRLAYIGRDLLLETLPDLFAGEVDPVKQNPDEVTFSPTITRAQEQLDWNQTAQQIDYHVRGFRPFPSTYTWLHDERVKVWGGHPVDYNSNEPVEPGTIVTFEPEQFIVACGDNTFYAVRDFQEHGKRRMKIKDSYNGMQAENYLGQQFQVKQVD